MQNNAHISALRALWKTHFSGAPECFASAPGRVNLIGEHTDYNEGFVFPAAITRRTSGLFRKSNGVTKIFSEQSGWGQEFSPGEVVVGKNWAKYTAGCAKALMDSAKTDVPALEGVITSDVPTGSGLSSSAALDLCLLSAWNELCRFGLNGAELAQVAVNGDRKYVGIQCGIMDQLASALGVRGHALFMDTRTLDTTPIPIPNGLQIAVMDTRKPRALAMSAYNERVAECKRAVEAIAKRNPDVKALRDATIEMLMDAKAEGLDDVAFRRARHVVTEDKRTLAFRDALIRGDLRSLGTLCRESHESLRSDYEVSCRELDAMARAAWTAPGCVAARMTGAGFGGCCVALVQSGAYQEFEDSVKVSYRMYPFREASYYPAFADDGAQAHLV